MKYDRMALIAAAELERRRRSGNIRKVWEPHPDNNPQQMAYMSDADELFYGGAAGGGKSALLIGLSITAHFRSILFRPEYTQLAELRDQTLGYVPNASKNWQEKVIICPDGRKIEFGAMDKPDDWTKFAGRPHDLVGLDEIQNFQKINYTMARAWARSTKKGQRVRIVCTGNPPTNSDGEWIIIEWAPWLDDSFSNPAKPGELRWFITRGEVTEWVDGPGSYDVDGRTVQARSRTFIPARVSDNPYFSDGQYESVLQSLPEILRAKMLDGDFSVKTESDPWQVIPSEWVDIAMERTVQYTSLDAIGVDVARGGSDKTVISRRYGRHFEPLLKYPGVQTVNGEAVARFVQDVYEQTSEVGVDAIGVGAAAHDAITAAGIPSTAMIAGEGTKETDNATGKLGFVNNRALWYWRLREALDPESGCDISLPRDSELKADLCAPRYSLQGTRIKLESKDDIKKRIGRSPDCGDAVVIAWAIGDNRHYFIGYGDEKDVKGPTISGYTAPLSF